MARKSTRGRPKGSGIDDDRLLKKINKLIAKDPHMKPTTAIKAVGIDDPSAIRRLRDKLNSAGLKSTGSKSSGSRRSKTKTARKTAQTKKSAAPRKAAGRKSTPKKVATRKARTTTVRAKKSTHKKTAARKTVATRTAASSRSAAKKSRIRKTVKTRSAPGEAAATTAKTISDNLFANPFADFTNGGAFAAQMPDFDMENIISSTVEKQIQIYESTVKFSPIAHMLRQQAMMTDMMLTILRTQKEITKPARNKR